MYDRCILEEVEFGPRGENLLRGKPDTFECNLILTSGPGGVDERNEWDGLAVWLRLGGLGRGEADLPLAAATGSMAEGTPSNCWLFDRVRWVGT